jgi:hypothetical protein
MNMLKKAVLMKEIQGKGVVTRLSNHTSQSDISILEKVVVACGINLGNDVDTKLGNTNFIQAKVEV